MKFYADEYYHGAAAVAVRLRDEVGALAPSLGVLPGAYRDVVNRIFSLGCQLDRRDAVVVAWGMTVGDALTALRNDASAAHLFASYLTT